MSTLSVPAVSELRAEPAAADEDLRPRDASWYPQARQLVSDLYQRSPAIYWTDFLLSISGAWALTAIYFTASTWSWLQIVSFLGASILFFRAGTFIHELVHMPQNLAQWRWFGRIWNLLMGIPLLAPWIMYRNHVDHHSAKYFGTPDDGEYLPLASSPVTEILKYLAQTPLLPLFQIVRFGILSPLSWLHPGLREWVLTATSAAVSNPYYRKRFPKRDEKHLLIVEVLCFAWILCIAALVVKGVITGHHVLLMYLLFAWSLSLNWIRNLAAHRYGNRGDRMTHLDQFSDSINITGQTWLTVLLFPVGLRYHALHHLFPSLPYHNLGKAHRRLSEKLPADSPYHATGRTSFFAATADLWRAAARTTREQSAMPRWLRRPQAN